MKIGDVEVRTTVHGLWPDVDILIKQEIIRAGVITETKYVDVSLLDYDQFLKDLQQAYETSKKINDEYCSMSM
jgi:hypothetical protein